MKNLEKTKADIRSQQLFFIAEWAIPSQNKLHFESDETHVVPGKTENVEF